MGIAAGGALAARRIVPAPGSEERLARRAQGGDTEAFDLIFRRYEAGLYRFCVGILHEPQDAQDALQNTMVKAMRALPGERRDIRLRPWLYRIAHNEAIELRRRRPPTEDLERPLVDAGANPDEHAERDLRLEKLFEDIGDLPERQRAALLMRELNGLDFGEIGDVLGTSPGAVRQALYEARRGLNRMKAGREMSCAAIARMLSDGDRRPDGRRKLRAHLRECPSCRRFQREIHERRRSFAAISPLPVVLAAVKSSGLGGIAKAAAAVLAIVAIGAAADKSGLISLPVSPLHRYPPAQASGGGTSGEGSGSPSRAGGQATADRGRATTRSGAVSSSAPNGGTETDMRPGPLRHSRGASETVAVPVRLPEEHSEATPHHQPGRSGASAPTAPEDGQTEESVPTPAAAGQPPEAVLTSEQTAPAEEGEAPEAEPVATKPAKGKATAPGQLKKQAAEAGDEP